jgi:hypothetical protein
VTRFSSLRPLVVLLAAAGILSLSARAAAGERQYSAGGTAQFVSSTEFVGTGQATHLGHYTEAGSVSFSPTADPSILRIDAVSIYTAANGDQLYANITGQLNGATGAITATVTYVGGTGRFDDATGSANLVGQILPDGTISVAVEGTIDY